MELVSLLQDDRILHRIKRSANASVVEGWFDEYEAFSVVFHFFFHLTKLTKVMQYRIVIIIFETNALIKQTQIF